jgi:hypothetical protein
MERIRRGERIDRYGTVRPRKDGSLIEISLTVSPIKDAEGIGASRIARDMTERSSSSKRNHRVKYLFSLRRWRGDAQRAIRRDAEGLGRGSSGKAGSCICERSMWRRAAR